MTEDPLVRAVQRNIDRQCLLQSYRQINRNLRQILEQYIRRRRAVPDIQEELEGLREANDLLAQRNRLLESQRDELQQLLDGVSEECKLVNDRVDMLEQQLKEEQFGFLEETDEFGKIMDAIETDIQEFKQSE